MMNVYVAEVIISLIYLNTTIRGSRNETQMKMENQKTMKKSKEEKKCNERMNNWCGNEKKIIII